MCQGAAGLGAGDPHLTALLRQDLESRGAVGRWGIGRDRADRYICTFATFQVTVNTLHMDFHGDLRQPQPFFLRAG